MQADFSLRWAYMSEGTFSNVTIKLVLRYPVRAPTYMTPNCDDQKAFVFKFPLQESFRNIGRVVRKRLGKSRRINRSVSMSGPRCSYMYLAELSP